MTLFFLFGNFKFATNAKETKGISKSQTQDDSIKKPTQVQLENKGFWQHYSSSVCGQTPLYSLCIFGVNAT